MKVGDSIDAVATFFNDIIGAIVPGATLGAGLALMYAGPASVAKVVDAGDGFLAMMLVAFCFAAGHGLLAIHAFAKKAASFAAKEILWHPKKVSKEALEDKAEVAFIAFQDLVINQLDLKPPMTAANQGVWGFHDLRSIAFTVSVEAGALGRRFMFISLLCSGMGTALTLILLNYAVCLAFAPSALYRYTGAWPIYTQVALLAASVIIFFSRGEEFFARAMSTPFPVALAELKLKLLLSK